MRITISSPDGMGDFILRIPMITALRDAGHKLQIFLREPAFGLAKVVLQEAELHRIESDPYHRETRQRKNPFLREHRAIAHFQPDLYVAALFVPNFFDDVWMESEGGTIPVAGFEAMEGLLPDRLVQEPEILKRCFHIRADVPADLPELEKNRRLGSAILGTDLAVEVPRLNPDEDSLRSARLLLVEHGIGEGNYLIACVGGRSGLKMKDWGEENWRKFFEAVLPADGRSVLFLGNPKEAASIGRIASGGFRSVNLSQNPPPIGVSLALAALSSGYVGRDSGVMHLAAAAGVPILAAYGGGHWGRFLPSSGPAVVVTQAMSCRGCNFFCPHERPHCITGISMETMLSGWEILSRTQGVEVLEQSPNPAVDVITSSEVHDFAMKREAEERAVAAKARSRGIWGRLFGGK